MNSEIVGLNYISLYIKDFEKAIEYYTQILGPPQYVEGKTIGWPMGSTWLTLFPSKYGNREDSNPCNAEFAIQMGTPEAVDIMYNKFLEAGAMSYSKPTDTKMYEPMRFACVDDPFGVRVDIYCPL